MRRILLAAAFAVGSIGSFSAAEASTCLASLICAAAVPDTCTGSVNVCRNADVCNGTVNVCPGADQCSGGVNVCDVNITR